MLLNHKRHVEFNPKELGLLEDVPESLNLNLAGIDWRLKKSYWATITGTKQ